MGIEIVDGAVKIGTRRYFLRNITSTKIDELPPAYEFGRTSLIVLWFGLFSGVAAALWSRLLLWGIFIAFLGFVAAIAARDRRKTYALVFSTAAGEEQAFISEDIVALEHADREIAEAISKFGT